MEHVIVDVDAGSDDAFALMLLLAGESSNKYRVVAITCTYGNTSLHNVVRNVLLILESMNRKDVPVYAGATTSLINNNRKFSKFHGEDGFGDKNFPDPKIKPQEENAVAAINRIATENKGVTLICLGPLTNLALALRTYPSLKNNMVQLWIMGGNTRAVGNVANTTAEYNFFQDPEAARIVLEEVTASVTLLPWEPCIGPPITTEWRFKTLGAEPTLHMCLLNAVEKDLYKNSESWNPCDAFLAAAFIDEKIIQSVLNVHLAVEIAGTYTRGQCVVLPGAKSNFRVIDELNFKIIKQMFMEAARYKPKD